jgi:ATP-dependent Clp protease, protease subunit
MIRNSIISSMRNHAVVPSSRPAAKPMFLAKINAKAAKSGEMFIYGEIGDEWYGGVSAQTVATALHDLGDIDDLDVYLNTPGGSVFEGIAIFNQFVRHKAKITMHVDALCASIGTIIMMAGNSIHMANNAQIMIHDPSGVCWGTADEMDKYADTLREVKNTLIDTYVARTKCKPEEVSKWMEDETWMRASVALERGFIDKIEEGGAQNSAVLAPILARYKNTPEELRTAAKDTKLTVARMQMRAAQIKNSRASPPNK